MKLNYIVENQKKPRVRSVRSDKKKSVRVWMDEYTYRRVLKNSKLNNMTITSFCSAIVSYQLQNREANEFDPVSYNTDLHVVHIKLTQSDYEKICSLSGEWMYTSIRQTVHRVLYQGLKVEGLNK
ncbi:hypothetical protein J2W44_006115 [Priestia aryabhattai]|uniref:hypothetical protein n=1 Tax=Priestia aryabhattai TaxID=412384 RepID=UPI0027E549C6|nr:hypothetical protein [Priestia aryabhattai]MDP9726959.1 hypothetical protein [Priestia aryabhattai]